jgi:hypothetical protein
MNRGLDLMERVTAADPLRGAERLTPEERREAEDLLARLLATPVGATGDVGHVRRRPRIRRWALVATGAAVSVAATVVALDLLGSSPSGGAGVVDKAVAAVTQEDSVYHIVEVQRDASRGIGRAKLGPFRRESWYSSDGRRHEKLSAVNGARPGRLLEEHAGRRRPGLGRGPLLSYDPRENTLYPSGFGEAPDTSKVPTIDPYGDPGASLRALKAQGLLRLAGTATVGGTSAYRLESRPIRRSDHDEERWVYLVDRETYLPLAQRYTINQRPGETLRFVSRYLSYERLPLNARTRTQLDLDRHPGAKCAIGAGELRGRRGLGFPNPCPPSGREGPARTR